MTAVVSLVQQYRISPAVSSSRFELGAIGDTRLFTLGNGFQCVVKTQSVSGTSAEILANKVARILLLNVPVTESIDSETIIMDYLPFPTGFAFFKEKVGEYHDEYETGYDWIHDNFSDNRSYNRMRFFDRLTNNLDRQYNTGNFLVNESDSRGTQFYAIDHGCALRSCECVGNSTCWNCQLGPGPGWHELYTPKQMREATRRLVGMSSDFARHNFESAYDRMMRRWAALVSDLYGFSSTAIG